MKITEMKEVLNLGAFINNKIYYIRFKFDSVAHEGVYYCDNIDLDNDAIIFKRLISLRGCESFEYQRFELCTFTLYEVEQIEPLNINVEYDSSLRKYSINTNIEIK